MVGGRCHEQGLNQSICPDHPYPFCFILSLVLDKKPDKHVADYSHKQSRMDRATIIDRDAKKLCVLNFYCIDCKAVGYCNAAVMLKTSALKSQHTHTNTDYLFIKAPVSGWDVLSSK